MVKTDSLVIETKHCKKGELYRLHQRSKAHVSTKCSRKDTWIPVGTYLFCLGPDDQDTSFLSPQGIVYLEPQMKVIRCHP